MRVVALPGVFRPISDSHQLARAAAREVSERGKWGQPPFPARALEIGTGSGLIATAMARAGAEVVAVDISRRALASAVLTARLNGARVRPVRSSLFDAVEGTFDVIASNPPYVPGPEPHEVDGLERAWSAGPDGRAVLDRLIDAAPEHLRLGGALLVVHSTINGEQQTLGRMRAAGLAPDVVERHIGPVGTLMRAAGVADAREEVLIIRGTLDHPLNRV